MNQNDHVFFSERFYGVYISIRQSFPIRAVGGFLVVSGYFMQKGIINFIFGGAGSLSLINYVILLNFLSLIPLFICFIFGMFGFALLRNPRLLRETSAMQMASALKNGLWATSFFLIIDMSVYLAETDLGRGVDSMTDIFVFCGYIAIGVLLMLLSLVCVVIGRGIERQELEDTLG